MESKRLIDRVMSEEGLTLEEIIAGAAKENQIYLKDMNGFEWHYFKIGFEEGIRLMEKVIKELKEECRR